MTENIVDTNQEQVLKEEHAASAGATQSTERIEPTIDIPDITLEAQEIEANYGEIRHRSVQRKIDALTAQLKEAQEKYASLVGSNDTSEQPPNLEDFPTTSEWQQALLEYSERKSARLVEQKFAEREHADRERQASAELSRAANTLKSVLPGVDNFAANVSELFDVRSMPDFIYENLGALKTSEERLGVAYLMQKDPKFANRASFNEQDYLTTFMLAQRRYQALTAKTMQIPAAAMRQAPEKTAEQQGPVGFSELGKYNLQQVKELEVKGLIDYSR
jgi:hypothetical protein